jgi:hypothetical protein
MANNKDAEEKKPVEGTETKSGKESQEEMVSVPKSQLAEILWKVERLESTADRSRLEQFDNANKKKELSRVRLNVYDDKEKGEQKVIMAWRMTIDEVMYDSGRGYTEKQVIELTLEDGTKVSLNYRDFAIGKRRSQEVAEILSRSKDEETGNELMKVRRVSDQKEFSVDSRFIN